MEGERQCHFEALLSCFHSYLAGSYSDSGVVVPMHRFLALLYPQQLVTLPCNCNHPNGYKLASCTFDFGFPGNVGCWASFPECASCHVSLHLLSFAHFKIRSSLYCWVVEGTVKGKWSPRKLGHREVRTSVQEIEVCGQLSLRSISYGPLCRD